MKNVTKLLTTFSVFVLMFSIQNCSHNPDFQTNLASEDPIDDPFEDETDDSEDPTTPPPAGGADYLAICNELKNTQLSSISNWDSIKNFKGEGAFSFDQVEKIQRVRANLSLVGTSTESSIQLIHKFRGHLLICFADVAKLAKTRGNIIVVNGNVGDISNFIGRLTITGGRIMGEIKNSQNSQMVIN